ncbi:hypothetical protein ACIBL3_09985 [Kribbella sp. NPDC050124]|uniref:DUF7144 family membrane protein n=1 Tax=Kribbella sp. NPDC050124 TaxID=3364114 RepID=UPI003799D6B3
MAAKRGGGAMAGFVIFAGVMMVITGLVNVFQGLVALFDDERLVITPDKFIVVDVTGWGWVLLISGLILLAVGAGVLVAQTWARITAIVVVGLHIVAQILSLGAYPFWSLLMIALDTVILYALTARWSDVRERIGRHGEVDVAWNGHDEDVQPTAAEQQQVPPRT